MKSKQSIKRAVERYKEMQEKVKKEAEKVRQEKTPPTSGT